MIVFVNICKMCIVCFVDYILKILYKNKTSKIITKLNKQ